MNIFRSLHLFNIFTSLFVLVFLTLALLCGWYFLEFAQHRERIQSFQTKIVEREKSVIQTEVHEAIDYIDFKRSEVMKRTRETIRSRVYEAHDLAMSVYRRNKGRMPREELQDLVRETLRPIRYQEGRGYYFATDLYGVEQLFADRPQLEGRNMLDMRGAGGKPVVKDMIALVEKQQEGFYEYQWSKPDHAPERHFPKIAFVKYFQPFHWLIGTGLYLDDIEKTIRREALQRISNIRYARDGYIYVLNQKGTLLTHPIASLVGKDLQEIENPDRVEVIESILALDRAKGAGFLEYDWMKPSTEARENKLSYIARYQPWSWIVGTGVYLDDIQEDIQAAQAGFKEQFRKQLFLTGVLFLAAVLITIFFITLFSRKIKSGLTRFRDFFVKSSSAYVEIDPDQLPFSEFAEIAASANAMNQERKQAEEQLRQSETKYRQLIETTPDAIALVDEEGTFLTVNPAMAANFHMTPQELEGKRFAEVMPEDLAAQRMDKGRETLQTNRVLYFKDQRDGRHFQVFYVPLSQSGPVRAFQVIARDITLQRQTEEALRNSEKSYKELFDSISDLIYTQDLQGRFLSVNPAMKNIFGYSEAEFLGRPASEFMDPELQGLFVSEYLAGIMHNGRHEGIGAYFTKNGRKVYIEYKSKLVRPETGEPYISGIGRDVTERILAERERKQLEAQLQQAKKLEAIGTLAGGMAHLFNNQLSVVLGNLELALTDMPDHHQSRNDLQEAMQSARRASEVSGQLLTYLGQASAKREARDLSEICRRNLHNLKTALPQTVELQSDLPVPGPVVLVNTHQIEQILNNLVTNAWEAMEHQPGSIQLRTGFIDRSDILQAEVYPHDWEPFDEQYACLEVRDSGSGMDPEDVEKIFDPFFTTKFTGRGLGLAVVLGVIKSCGGAISLETEKQKGTRLRIYLPLFEDVSREQPAKTLEDATWHGKGAVLLAEDQEMVRNMAKSMLEHMGYEVFAAADGEEALALFRKHQGQICCLLTDLSMPGLDGWQTLEAVREIQGDLPAILASGYDQAQIMHGEHAELPQAYLNKPFQLAELKAALAQVFGAANAAPDGA